MIYYITKPNDTLQRISAKMYGDWTLWYLIFDNNRGLFPNRWIVQSGLMVYVPIPLTQNSTHTIQTGDSYTTLSIDYYSSEHYAKNIKAKNNGIILNENIGKKIIIPALVKSGTYESAQDLIGGSE